MTETEATTFLRQRVSFWVEHDGVARCLYCGKAEAVRMYLDPGWIGYYVRCRSCLVFYPMLPLSANQYAG